MTAPKKQSAKPAADTKDAQIADLEQLNEKLRAQIADLLEQLDQATREQGPATPPPAGAKTQDSPPSASGFDVEARTQELARQGVPEADAAEQAGYEARLWADRQAPQG
jgi:hypothetical protein